MTSADTPPSADTPAPAVVADTPAESPVNAAPRAEDLPRRPDDLAPALRQLLAQWRMVASDTRGGSNVSANTVRALERDLVYWAAWYAGLTGRALTLPATPATVRQFVAHHLYAPDTVADSGFPALPPELDDALQAAGLKRAPGPWKPASVRRRLASLATLHAFGGHESPTEDRFVRLMLRRGGDRTVHAKAGRAVTRDMLRAMLACCDGLTRRDRRDRALLLFIWASGGRRRAEAAALTRADLAPDRDAHGAPIYRVRLSHSKTRQKHGRARPPLDLLLRGPAARAMRDWLSAADLSAPADADTPVFRSIDRFARIGPKLSATAINAIVKQRAAAAGFDPAHISAHSLRAGFLTQAALDGVSMPEAMALSDHTDVRTVQRYWRPGALAENRATALFDDPTGAPEDT